MISTNKSKKSGFKYTVAQDLLNQPPPQPEHIVENLLTPGLTILAAAPKSGKSTFLTYLLANISRGTGIFLTRKVKKSKVLYMGLEDGVARFYKRLEEFSSKDVFGGDIPLTDFLITTETEKTGSDFVEELKSEIKKMDFKVVVIDILHKIFDPKKRFGYAAQYDIMATLQKCAEETGTAIIVVHHTNKRAKSGLASISGTQGLTAAADNIFIMNKSTESWADSYLILSVEGRDIDAQEIWLEYNLSDMGYVELPHPPLSPNRINNLKNIADLRSKGQSQAQIAQALNISQPTVSRYINQIKHTPKIVGLSEEEADKL